MYVCIFIYIYIYICLCCSVLQSVAECCNVLQCVAVYCCVLQCVAVCCNVLQCVVMCCSVLQCVAVYCRILQCVAVCCSVLQYVATCCNMFQGSCFFFEVNSVGYLHWQLHFFFHFPVKDQTKVFSYVKVRLFFPSKKTILIARPYSFVCYCPILIFVTRQWDGS